MIERGVSWSGTAHAVAPSGLPLSDRSRPAACNSSYYVLPDGVEPRSGMYGPIASKAQLKARADGKEHPKVCRNCTPALRKAGLA